MLETQNYIQFTSPTALTAGYAAESVSSIPTPTSFNDNLNPTNGLSSIVLSILSLSLLSLVDSISLLPVLILSIIILGLIIH